MASPGPGLLPTTEIVVEDPLGDYSRAEHLGDGRSIMTRLGTNEEGSMNPSPMATRLAVFSTAILISMSAYLPWVTGISGLGTASRSGLDGGGDGVYVLAIGLTLGFVALLAGARLTGGAAILVGLLALGVAWLDANDIATGGADRSRSFVAVSLGGGLYLLAFAGALSLIAGLMLLAAFRRQGHRSRAR